MQTHSSWPLGEMVYTVRFDTGVILIISGGNLPYCRNTSLQCCTAEYLMMRRMQLMDTTLPDALRDQLDDNLDALRDVQDTFENCECIGI